MLGIIRQYYKNPKTKWLIVKAIFFSIVLLYGLYMLFDIGMSFKNVRKEKIERKNELNETKKRLDTLTKETSIDKDFYQEKSAREKLYMVKEGEELIVIFKEDKN
jgi:cell division protein FtsB